MCEKFGRKFGPFLSMLMVCVWMFNFSNTCMSVVRTCMHEVSMASAIVVLSHIHVWCCVCSCLVIIDDNCDGFLGVVLTIFPIGLFRPLAFVSWISLNNYADPEPTIIGFGGHGHFQ